MSKPPLSQQAIIDPRPYTMPTRERPLNKPTIVLFFGGGQDSTALLYKYYYDAAFREKYVGNAHFLVIMAETGNEYPGTYIHVAQVANWCRRVGIEFHFVTPQLGYHSNSWQSLQAQMVRNSNIVGVAFKKTCTDNLKIQPCYRFLQDWLRSAYHFKANGHKVYYEYAHYYGKLNTWIGFAAGEEGRVDVQPPSTDDRRVPSKQSRRQASAELPQPPPAVMVQGVIFAGEKVDKGKEYIPKWRKLTVTHLYPLIDLLLDRKGCQVVIAGYGHSVPYPSHCMMCPFQGEAEIVYLARVYPADWQYWIEREAAKLTKFSGGKLNLGVKGKKTLSAYLDKALLKYGEWTTERLEEYRFSHGHCVMSKY